MSVTYGRPVALLAFLGATVGPALDGLHTYSGATWYPDAQFLKSVWWCPPLFCAAGVAIGLGRLLTERVMKVETHAPGGRAVAVTMGAFVVAYAASGFLPVSEVARAVLLLMGAVALWAAFDRTLAAVLCMASAGAGGWLVEHTLVGRGLFFHREVFLDGVALWIPPLYFTAALAIGAVARQVAVRE
ncbi:MAG: hypothetical protein JNM17_03945 [Archangium sp.]|nr:hypothetical protein [Archangium sp.]